MKKIFLLCLLIASPCYAALNLELTRGVNNAIPIAIVPFGGQETDESSTKITTIIKNDLKNSGRFTVLPENKMPNQPHTASAVNAADWRQASVDNVVAGEVIQTDSSNNKVNFALMDVVKNQSATLLKKTFDNIEKKDFRRLAHHISDLIYETLIGEKGPFSSRIAYILTQHTEGMPNRYSLEIADADGYNPRSILTSSQPIMSPAWSHDGRKIAYVSFENHESQIYIGNIANGERQPVSSFSGINGAPAWSPDDRQLALVLSKSGSPKIYILNLATKSLRQITQGSSIDTEPNWSPKGNAILFTSDRGGGPQLYKISLGTHKIERVTYDGRYNARGSFSPDGKRIVMIHGDGGGYNIAVQDVATGTLESLTKSGNDASPTFSRGGTMVLYETRSGNKRTLGMISSDGRVKLTLPAREGEVQDPAWSS